MDIGSDFETFASRFAFKITIASDDRRHLKALALYLYAKKLHDVSTYRVRAGRVSERLPLGVDQVLANLDLLKNERGIFYSESGDAQIITDEITFCALADIQSVVFASDAQNFKEFKAFSDSLGMET